MKKIKGSFLINEVILCMVPYTSPNTADRVAILKTLEMAHNLVQNN